MVKHQIKYVQLRNGILVVKSDNYSILGCDFVDKKDQASLGDIKIFSALNARYINFKEASNNAKTTLNNKPNNAPSNMTQNNTSNQRYGRTRSRYIVRQNHGVDPKYHIVGETKLDQDNHDEELVETLESTKHEPKQTVHVSSELPCLPKEDVITTLLMKFYYKLIIIFENHDNIVLFLHYLAKLFLFNNLSSSSINPQAHIVTIGDTQNYLRYFASLFIPNFFETQGTYGQTFLFERDSWKKNKLFETIFNNELFNKTCIQILGYNSIITPTNVDQTGFLKISSKSDVFESKTPHLDASILLWMIVDTINSCKISKGIKKRHNIEILNHLTKLSANN